MIDPEERNLFDIILQSIQVPADLDYPYIPHLRLLMKGVLSTLLADESRDSILALERAVLRAPVPEIQADSLAALQGMATKDSPDARESLARLAVLHGHAGAIAALKGASLSLANRPLQAAFLFLYGTREDYAQFDLTHERLTDFYLDPACIAVRERIQQAASARHQENLAWILESLANPSDATLAALVDLYPAFTHEEQQLVFQRYGQLALEGHKSFREAICRLALTSDENAIRQFTLEHSLEPEDIIQRAQFLFLTGQWQRYETLDFTHKYLAMAYNLAGPAQRQRILAQARYAGQITWLEQVSQVQDVRWLKDLSDADWQSVLRQLVDANRLNELWKLSQSAPATWTANILHELARLNWQPGGPDENAAFAELVQLAQSCHSDPLKILPTRTLNTPGQGINAVASNRKGSKLLCGGADSTLYLWNLNDRSWLPKKLLGPSPQTRSLAFSPDDEYIACASGDNVIRVYHRQDLSLVKSLAGHQALVRSLLVHPDGRTMFSASFDGALRAWRFPLGPQLKNIQPDAGELFSLALFSDTNLLAGSAADGTIRVWKWPEGIQLRMLDGTDSPVIQLANGNGQLLAGYTRSGKIQVWNVASGKSVDEADLGDARLVSLIMDPDENWLYTQDINGNVTIWNLSTLEPAATLSSRYEAAAGLVLINEGNVLVSAHDSGELAFWDLSIFNLVHEPAGSETHRELEQVNDLLANPNQATANRRWLEFMQKLLAWKARFDIQIGEPQRLQVGEFDIQL